MKGKGDNPIVGSETPDIYDGENHGYKENNSLEKDDLRAFATHWTSLFHIYILLIFTSWMTAAPTPDSSTLPP